jgi:hypothetical protein
VKTEFWWENMREGQHLGDASSDRIISNGSSRSGMKNMDWIDLAQDRDRWRSLVYMVMNLSVP